MDSYRFRHLAVRYETDGATFWPTNASPNLIEMVGAACAEILRLAEREKELEAEVDAALLGQAQISESSGRAWELAQERNRELREALAPFLAAFRERAAAWERAGIVSDREIVDLTAPISVSAFRALLKED